MFEKLENFPNKVAILNSIFFLVFRVIEDEAKEEQKHFAKICQ